MPVVQPSTPATQLAVTSTSDKPLSSSSTVGPASQYPDSESEQQTDLTSPVYPGEEGEVDGEAGIQEQDSDQ